MGRPDGGSGGAVVAGSRDGGGGGAVGGNRTAGGDRGGAAGDDRGVDAGPGDRDAGSIAPFDWVGVVGSGQSLATGYTIAGGPSVSTTQPFHNLKLLDSGPDPKYPADGSGAPVWSAVPLTEPMRPRFGLPSDQYPNNIYGETPHSGMANALSAIWHARTGGDYVSAHTDVALGGRALVYIAKDTPSFQAAVNEARVFGLLAAAVGKTYGVGGIIFTHGEADAYNADYGAGVVQLQQDYDAALKAATGQTRDVVMLATQQSSSDGSGSSAVQLWRAGADHPGQIACVGPKYQYEYSDGVHLTQPGYLRMGEKYGEVFDRVVNQGGAWKPVGPKSVARTDVTVTIDFDVPNPPLEWDQTIPAPHAKAHTAWSNGRGFEVTDGSGNELTIVSAEIVGATSVVLTLATSPSGPLTVGYAVTGDAHGCCWAGYGEGPHGQLRDSDDLVGYDAETIFVQATNGSPQILAPATALARRAGRDVVTGAGLPADTIVRGTTQGGLTLSAPWSGPTGTASLSFHHDLHNYCVHFSMAVP
jgi:hypothetical protein